MPNEIHPIPSEPHDRYAIVVAQWNQSVTGVLCEGAIERSRAAGVPDDQIDVAWVPGSWEIPLVAQRFAEGSLHAAVICLGVVVRGETSHNQHINRGVSLAISQISLQFDVPVLFGILTCESMEQAVDRAGGAHGNKGLHEAALRMVGLLKNLPAS